MRIYSDPGSEQSSSSNQDLNFGHTFLTFFNTSTKNIVVGRHTVAPKKMISIGKFENFENEANGFKGAFYNVEVQRKAYHQWYQTDHSIYLDLNATQLDTVSTIIKSSQDGYAFVGNNCASFAARVWNSVLPNPDHPLYINHFTVPKMVYQDITRTGQYLKGNGLMQSDYARCYYLGSVRHYCKDKTIPE